MFPLTQSSAILSIIPRSRRGLSASEAHMAMVPQYIAMVPQHMAMVPQYIAMVPQHMAMVPQYMAMVPQHITSH
ncbi:unnamed protein product [Boreogadus saida]